MSFGKFTGSCNHYHNYDKEWFPHSQKFPCTATVSSFFPTPDLLQPLNSALFTAFAFFSISYKYNHTLYNLSFIQHNAFEIQPCYFTYQYFVAFINEAYSNVWMYNSLFIHSPLKDNFGCFSLG